MGAPDQPGNEPRQRWRIVFARLAEGPEARPSADAPPEAARERNALTLAIDAAGLPLARSGGRPKISIAVPLPPGMAGDHELLDVVLTERWSAADVRERVVRAMPADHRLVDVHDVWLGEPSLPAQVAAADYAIELAEEGQPGEWAGSSEVLAEACRRLIESASIVRARLRGGRAVEYDLRPLLDEVSIAAPGPPVVLSIRTRFSADGSAGRPDEVVAALSDIVGFPLRASAARRSRLWLTSELPG